MQNILSTFAQNITIPGSSIGLPHIAADNTTWSIFVSTAFIAIGAAASLFLLIGAIMYITSNGEQGAIKKAKDTILYAVVGIVVSALAFTIVQFVLGKVIP